MIEEIVKKKKWTIMVYLAGDNDLGEDMTKRVIDMRAFTRAYQNKNRVNNFNLLVYFDCDNPLSKTRVFNLNSSTEPQPLIPQLVLPDGTLDSGTTNKDGVKKLMSEIKSANGNHNSASKYTIEGFVKWCIEEQEAKADHYALILAGHGDGFQQTTFMKDINSGDSLTIQDVKEILVPINKDILKRKKLDILAFDSCVMNTIEVANEMKGVAEIMVGSQGYMPTTGWSYRQFVERLLSLDRKLTKNLIPNISPNDVALAMLSAVNFKNKEMSELYRRSTDLAVIDLDNQKLANAGKAMNAMAAALTSAVKKELSKTPGGKPLLRRDTAKESRKEKFVRKPLLKAILSAHWKCQTFLFDQSVDIIDFCEYMHEECETLIHEYNEIIETQSVPAGSDISEAMAIFEGIAKSCRIAENAVKECVIINGFSGPDYQFAQGISTIFPWNLGTLGMITPQLKKFGFFYTPARKQTVDRVSDLKASAWIDFINLYLDETCRKKGEKEALAEDRKRRKEASETKQAKELIRLGFHEIFVEPFDALVPPLNAFAENFEHGERARLMLDPPPRSQLISEGLYKAYFRRVKNFSLHDTGSFPLNVFQRSNGNGDGNRNGNGTDRHH